MSARPTVDQLAVRVCHAVRDVRGEYLAWIVPDRVQDHLGWGKHDDRCRRRVRGGGRLVGAGWKVPAHSVLLMLQEILET